MIAVLRTALALLALARDRTPAPARAQQVDLLLVLAADVSRSVDHPKFLLQREGYAAAISNPQVLDAITLRPATARSRSVSSNGRASARRSW